MYRWVGIQVRFKSWTDQKLIEKFQIQSRDNILEYGGYYYASSNAGQEYHDMTVNGVAGESFIKATYHSHALSKNPGSEAASGIVGYWAGCSVSGCSTFGR